MRIRRLLIAIAVAGGFALSAAPAAAGAATTHPAAASHPVRAAVRAAPRRAVHVIKQAAHTVKRAGAGAKRALIRMVRGAKRSTTFLLCLLNSPNHKPCITAEGQGHQAQMGSGAVLSEGDCGFIDGMPVFAFNNQNNLFLHYLSNQQVTFDNNNTNGCSNNADKWIEVPNNGERFAPFNNINQLLGTSDNTNGSPVFIGGSPAWNRWTDVA